MSIVQELESLEKNTERKLFTFKKTKFTSAGVNNLLEFDDTQYKLSQFAMTRLADDLEIPTPYLKRIPPQLKEMTINFLMKNRGDAQSAVLVNKETDTVRSFIDPQHAYVPAKRIYDVVDGHLKDMEVANSVVTDESVEIIAFSPEFDTHVVDSPVRAGLRVLFSDSWSLYPRFDSYICRIQCLNSAITPIESRKFRVSKKSETDILLQAQSFIDTAVSNIKPMIEGFQKLEKEQVDNWLTLIKKICQENKLPKKLQDMIALTANDPQFLATVSNKSIETMHDMVNLLTYVATHHPELTAVNRENLFSIAGHIMLHHDTRCNSCGGTLV